MEDGSSSGEEHKGPDPFAKKPGFTPNYNQSFGKKRKLLSQPAAQESQTKADGLKCPFKNCGRGFASEQQLKEHMTRRHKPEPPKTEQIDTTSKSARTEAETTVDTPVHASQKMPGSSSQDAFEKSKPT